MKLCDMKYSKKEKAEQESPKLATSVGGSDYPYGLSLSLDTEQLKKLGISSMPKIGKIMQLKAVAVVTSVSQSDSQGGGVSRRMELQLQKLGLEEGHESAEEAMGEAIEKVNT